MIGDGTGESAGEISVVGVEGQEHQDGLTKVLDVLGLDLISATGIGLHRHSVRL